MEEFDPEMICTALEIDKSFSPEKFILRNNFPNPFSSNTQLSFEITRDSDVTLDIYSLGGRRIWHYNGLNSIFLISIIIKLIA